MDTFTFDQHMIYFSEYFNGFSLKWYSTLTSYQYHSFNIVIIFQVHQTHPQARRSFLYYGDAIIQQPIMLKHLTERLVYDAKSFIHNNTNRPFFLYFSLPQTHTPMFNQDRFKGKSRRGKVHFGAKTIMVI